MHLWTEKILRAQALVTCEFYHGEALPKIVCDGLWAFCQTSQGGKIQKNIIPPSKIIGGWGETIPRCWSSRCCHDNGHSELLALAKSGLEPTYSSLKVLLTYHLKIQFSFNGCEFHVATEAEPGKG
jgi:hypothetical protein